MKYILIQYFPDLLYTGIPSTYGYILVQMAFPVLTSLIFLSLIIYNYDATHFEYEG